MGGRACETMTAGTTVPAVVNGCLGGVSSQLDQDFVKLCSCTCAGGIINLGLCINY